MISVVIAEDQQIILDGLKALLIDKLDLVVVGQATNGRDCLNVVSKTRPDVLLLDIEMPQMDGIETSRAVKEKFPNTKILILSMHNSGQYISQLIAIGVDGYILKNMGSEQLVEAIRDLHDGKIYYGRDITETIVKGINEAAKQKEKKQIILTPRESEVLALIADGMSTPEISEKLFIAHSTVETHRRNLIDKTGVKNSKGLIKWAINNGYLS